MYDFDSYTYVVDILFHLYDYGYHVIMVICSSGFGYLHVLLLWSNGYFSLEDIVDGYGDSSFTCSFCWKDMTQVLNPITNGSGPLYKGLVFNGLHFILN